jgi:hypothetical protein
MVRCDFRYAKQKLVSACNPGIEGNISTGKMNTGKGGNFLGKGKWAKFLSSGGKILSFFSQNWKKFQLQ